MKTFKIRAAQLDLARQMETPEFICDFMDMISENGYNALFLYLEDRIITPSYPYPAPKEAYTCDQIRQIVDYASGKGLEVIPCVATLGHAERFLRFPQLQHLSEVRGDSPDRFGGNAKNSFCVSLPEFYQFLFDYLDDILPLFPSRYFHAGLDEFWNFNLCELCRAKVKNFHDEELLFAGHIRKVHQYLTSKGKQMAMWPDMFENYHTILPTLPKDIIMTEWQYQRDVRTCQAHFNNLTEENTLARYQKLGFEVWAAPADMLLGNGQSFLDYASGYDNVTGFLQTAWEKSDTFMFRTWPIIAANGRKAAGIDEEKAFSEAVTNLFGIDDKIFSSVEKAVLLRGFARHFSTAGDSVLYSRSIFGLDRADTAALESAKLLLDSFRSKIQKGQTILEDQLMSIEELILSGKIKKAMLEQLDFGRNAEAAKQLKNSCDAYLSLFRQREKDWEKFRPNIEPNVFTLSLPDVEQRFEKAQKAVETGAFLRLRRMHSDWYGMPKLRIQMRLDGTWHEVYNGCAKPDNLECAEFDFFHAIDRKFLNADAVRFENSGYGGLGLCYFELRDNTEVLKVPGKILETEHLVSEPDNLLSDDSKFCFLGSKNMYESYVNQKLVNIMHRVDAELKDCNE